MEKIIELPPYNVAVFSNGKSPRAVCLIASLEECGQVWDKLQEPKPTIISVSGMDWNRELSPWPAPGVFRNQGDFTGEGDKFLCILLEKLLPEGLRVLEYEPESLGIAGYSLGGLFAVWTLWNTDIFSAVASMSGSMWFDNFLEYARAQRPVRLPELVYLSVGSGEKKSRNKRMAAVEKCTREMANYFENSGSKCVFLLEPGGHFSDVPERIARGIEVIAGEREIQ